jgi:peroxiredoxin (alkyl hydroperoxide reductase subunit C)
MDGKESGVTCNDWFFCTRKIDKEKVLAAIKK